MWFGKYLVECGDISKDQLIDAVSEYCEGKVPIGAVAVSCKLLTVKQVFEVLENQSSLDKPFGEVAVAMGYISTHDLHYLLGRVRFETTCWQESLVIQKVISQEDLTQRRREWRRIIHKPIVSEAHLMGP